MPRTPDDEWLVADSAWWGRSFGRCALRLRCGVPVGGPIPYGSTLEQGRFLSGTLLPGLRDAHVHSGLIDVCAVRSGGISEVYDLGSPPEVLAELRADASLPLVRFAGAFLTAPGGYPTDRSWALPGSCREVSSVEDAVTAVREQQALGAHFIKVVLHTGAGPSLPDRTLDAIVSTAHTLALTVIAHAEGEGTFRAAYDHGVDRLAHTPWTERIPDHLLSEAARRMVWISTLDIHGYGSETEALGIAIDNLRGFVDHGGTVQYGTDLGNGPLPLGVNAREVRALQRAGLSPEDILATMTDLAAAAAPCWVPGGLDLRQNRFADSLRHAKVIDATRVFDGEERHA